MQKALNGKDQKVVVAEGSGSWLESIEFDGKIYWTIEDSKPDWILINDDSLNPEYREYLLESDSSTRPDIKCMIENNFEQADKEKHILEELQRKDKAMR